MCGASLLVAAVPGSGDAVCAVHPELRSLHACARCGSFACAQCVRRSEAGELLCASCEARAPRGQVPWDRREELGTLRAFWDTCLDILLRPTPTFERLGPGGTMGGSLGFAALCSLAGILTTALIYMVVMTVVASTAAPNMEGNNMSPTAFRAAVAGAFGVWILLAPVFGLITTLFCSGGDHLLLRMMGTQQEFNVTLRGNALSQAPYLLGLIPFCAIYVAPFWTVGLRVIAYRNLHSTTWGTAAFGALAGPVLSILLCGGSYLALVLSMAALAK
jgi:hypothetical protein